MSKNILITGASGLIGTHLTDSLYAKGHRVAHLSRTPRSAKAKTFLWDIGKHTIDETSLQPADAIVHLAGASVADKPWTKERKEEILRSRVDSTRLLYDALKKGNHNVKTFVSASGIGYYGFDHGDKSFTENDAQGEDFLAEVVREWEGSVDAISSLGIRVIKIRIGIVLSDEGGALKEIKRPVKLYAGAPLGSGTQRVSWIHLTDLCNIFIKAIEDESMQGVYNAVAPHPVTNTELTRTIAKVMDKPLILPAIPSFVIKFLFGEMADLVLKGATVSSKKIQSTGFRFRFEYLEPAIEDLLGTKRRSL